MTSQQAISFYDIDIVCVCVCVFVSTNNDNYTLKQFGKQ